MTTPAACFYNNDPDFPKHEFGLLYNWYAVNTGKVCPVGYHVPSSDEWKELETFIGTTDVDSDDWRGTMAYKLKADYGWNETTIGFNTTGFTAVPAGYRYSNGDFEFSSSSDQATFWTTTIDDVWDYICFRSLKAEWEGIHISYTRKNCGMSVRCVKNK